MTRRPLPFGLFILAVLALILPLTMAALTRPPSKGSSPLASTVLESRLVNGESEGKAYLRSLKPALRAQLEKDRQVLLTDDQSTGKSFAGYIRALALFKQSKARTWALIAEPVKQPTYLPRLVGAKTLDTPPNGELVQFKLKIMFVNIVLHTRHWFYPEQSRVEWALDKSYKSDISTQEGYWQLFALTPDTVVGEYGTLVDTGVAVPHSIQDYLARKDIPGALEAFRAYIDSDGKFRRPE